MATKHMLLDLPSQLSLRGETVRIAVVGAGGIGSHFCRLLHKLIEGRQIANIRWGKPEPIFEHVDVYDFDSVAETNLKHQDFASQDMFAPKSLVMGVRYGFNPKCERFVESHLEPYAVYCLCADNPGVRALVYRHVCRHNARPTSDSRKYFVDMRAEGDMVALFTDRMPLDSLLDSLGGADTRDSVAGRSCQMVGDITEGRIQLGNFLVPVMGAQALLKMARGQNYPASQIQVV